MRRLNSIIIIINLLSINLSFSQDKGIHFEKGLSWEQIKDKAAAEHKYIFMDVFATWCGPCRMMDQTVYSDSAVGIFANTHFVSVKLQIDSTKGDDRNTIAWRETARQIINKCKVKALPSYLFFNCEGELVHRDQGREGKDNFLNRLMRDAADPIRQQYTLLKLFKGHALPPKDMPYLIGSLDAFAQDEDAAREVAQFYIDEYVTNLPDSTLFTAENMAILSTYMEIDKNKAFDIFYNSPEKVDRVTEKGYAYVAVFHAIASKELAPKLWRDKNFEAPLSNKPDWDNLISTIKKKYPQADGLKMILDERIFYYEKIKDWDEVIKAYVEKNELFGIDTLNVRRVNNMCWDVFFLHSNDKIVLKKAARWQKVVVEKAPNNVVFIDTYANILYKAGRIKEACDWEEKALKIAPQKKDILVNLALMRANKPTWISQ